jgi:hypothetical protein
VFDSWHNENLHMIYFKYFIHEVMEILTMNFVMEHHILIILTNCSDSNSRCMVWSIKQGIQLLFEQWPITWQGSKQKQTATAAVTELTAQLARHWCQVQWGSLWESFTSGYCHIPGELTSAVHTGLSWEQGN